MGRKSRFQSEALQHLHERYVGDDPERVASFEAALANAEVARDIYRLRSEAGLTQQQLAKLVGTTASVISRLEDADYEGHSLAMLRRVAAALGRRVEVRFPPRKAGVPGWRRCDSRLTLTGREVARVRWSLLPPASFSIG